MKKLLYLLLAAGCATAAHAQVPLSGSTVTATISSSAPYSFVTSQPSSAYAGFNGFTSYGRNGTGDMDFVAANNGSSPSFYWYFLLGSSVTAEMSLGTTGILTVNNGIDTNHVAATSVATSIYTVATLPSPITAGAGTQVVVSDASGTVGSCGAGGGGSYMIALSNGSTWSCH